MVFRPTWENPPLGSYWLQPPAPQLALAPLGSSLWSSALWLWLFLQRATVSPTLCEALSILHSPVNPHPCIIAWLLENPAEASTRECVSENAMPGLEALSLVISTCSRRPPRKVVQKPSHANQNWTKQAPLWVRFHSGLWLKLSVKAQHVTGPSPRTGKLSEEFPIPH